VTTIHFADVQCAGYVICNSLVRPAVAIGPSIQEVCGLLCCEDAEALLGAVQCVLSPKTFNDDNPFSTQEAEYGDP
jgi:hypothetical protein